MIISRMLIREFTYISFFKTESGNILNNEKDENYYTGNDKRGANNEV